MNLYTNHLKGRLRRCWGDMNKDTLSVAMARALDAWPLRVPGRSIGADIAALAVAHGVSSSGLYRALLRAGQIPAANPRRAA